MQDFEYQELIKKVIRQQRDLLYSRKEDDGHKDTIKNSTSPNKSEREFYKLINSVFNHHELNDFLPLNELPEIESKSEVSKYFHDKYYCPIPIRKGRSKTNPEISVDEILERLCSKKGTKDSNQVHFMVGEIGLGKTTFLCNLLYKNWHYFVERKVLPVRINLDRLTEHSIPVLTDESDLQFTPASVQQTLSNLKEMVFSTIEANEMLSFEEILELREQSRTSQDAKRRTEIIQSLSHLIDLLRSKHGISPLFIIDNIDYLYHLGDRGIFGENLMPITKHAYDSILELIQLFFNQAISVLARKGLNVLYVVRPETIEFLENQRNDLPIEKLRNDAFSLCNSAYNVQLAREVISKRFQMLGDLVSKIPAEGKQSRFQEGVEKLNRVYIDPSELAKRLMDDLWGLSRKGIRDLVHLFCEYAWIDHGAVVRESLNLRFNTQYSPSIIAYILGGNKRYTQFKANLPNIFLVNTEAHTAEFGVPESFKEPRPYTLWIKFLALSFLSSRKEITTTVGDFLNVFSGINRNAYHPDLVRYVLGSLTEVPAAEFIEYSLGSEIDGAETIFIKDFSITDRAEFFLKKFANSFTYVQLVLDDWRLNLPIDLAKEFEYVEPDYGYLTSEDYGVIFMDFLPKKGIQTLKFSIYLEEALEIEKRIYPNVFRRLKMAGVFIPHRNWLFSQVKKDFLRVFELPKSQSQIKQEQKKQVKNLIEQEHVYREKFRKSLNKIYKGHLSLHEQYYQKQIPTYNYHSIFQLFRFIRKTQCYAD